MDNVISQLEDRATVRLQSVDGCTKELAAQDHSVGSTSRTVAIRCLASAHQSCVDGDLKNAVVGIKAAIAHGLCTPDILHSLAYLLFQSGAFVEVRTTTERILEDEPDSAEALCLRILASVLLGLWSDLHADVKKLVGLKIKNLDLLVAVGVTLKDGGHHGLAIAVFDVAAVIQPASEKILAMRGVCHNKLGDYLRAEHDLRRALTADPHNVELMNDYAVALHNLGKISEALSLLEIAVKDAKNSPHVWFNHGNVLRSLDQREGAVQSYERAIALSTHFVDAIYNKGLTHYEQLELESALECYNRVLAIDPAHAKARWNKAICTLLVGDWKAGWALFEARWAVEIGGLPAISMPGIPRWSGRESLFGRSLLVVAEQGFGDTIQFCRYLQCLRDQGAIVTVYARAQLEQLFQGVEGVSQFVRHGSTPPATDYFLPMMSLPAALGVYSPEAAPVVGYLRADPRRVTRYQRMLVGGHKLKLGVAWRGSPTNASDIQRSIALSTFAQCFSDECEIFCLQNEVRGDEEQELRRNGVHILGKCDFADAAALITSLDIVITVDTSFAHLAGALQVPVWILLPYVPDWRWGLKHRDSVWYPTATLYRQQADRCWARVIAEVKMDLRARIMERSSPDLRSLPGPVRR